MLLRKQTLVESASLFKLQILVVSLGNLNFGFKSHALDDGLIDVLNPFHSGRDGNHDMKMFDGLIHGSQIPQ